MSLGFNFVASDTDYSFKVISFKGSEEIGELYRYTIDLSSNDDIDFDKMLISEVYLQLRNTLPEDDVYIHGVLEQFEVRNQDDNGTNYRAYLVPKLWRLTLAQNQNIFLNQTIPDILIDILDKNNIEHNSYLTKSDYVARDYVCQYKESRYDFLKRWMQREGIYFYFEQVKDGCKVAIIDIKDKQTTKDNISYQPTSSENQVISSIVYRTNNTIQSVHMRDYNYEKVSNVEYTTLKTNDDYTRTYLYGNNLSSVAEATTLTDRNEEKYKCLEKEMLGESGIISLRPGYFYTLNNYFKSDLNDKKYLMVRMDSYGTQQHASSMHYNNTFTMIPSETQYRMQTTTPWPYVSGMISAKIATDVLDSDGRYKVKMPFDMSDSTDCKKSCYIRMAQSSAGVSKDFNDTSVTQGIHFPLHEDTEVLISFIDGDPDQPVIVGAVPNSDSPSPVTGDSTKSIIKTHGGSVIEFDDSSDNKHILLGVYNYKEMADDKSNDKDDDYKDVTLGDYTHSIKIGGGTEEHFGIMFKTEGNSESYVKGDSKEVRLGDQDERVHGNKFDIVYGTEQNISIGNVSDIHLVSADNITLGLVFEATVGAKVSLQAAWGWDIASKGMTAISPAETRLTDTEDILTANRIDIVGDRLNGIDSSVGVLGDKTTAIETAIGVVEANTGVNQTDTRIVGTKIQALESYVTRSTAAITNIGTMALKLGAIIKESDIEVEEGNLATRKYQVANWLNTITIIN